MLCVCASGPSDVFGPCAVSTFREYRLHVATDRCAVPPAKARSDAATNSYCQALARHGPLAVCPGTKVGLLCGIAGIATPGSSDVLRPAVERLVASGVFNTLLLATP